ncbi:MAG: hypothetical protein IPP29_15825 [Bacteroidetes bacterium]|nr:hypothetical protein [Bacteroidota bacterium]MBL0052868.1 hypothetical protein [Bacteroidota bacterium]
MQSNKKIKVLLITCQTLAILNPFVVEFAGWQKSCLLLHKARSIFRAPNGTHFIS